MPVSPEIIHNPSPEDLQDLQKIYNSAPPVEVQSALEGEGLLIAGRFNSRLLGAFVLSPASGGRYSLVQLQVRDITRRRGVARQLLQLALRKLPAEVVQIEADLADHPELMPFFQELGFATDIANHMSWSRPS